MGRINSKNKGNTFERKIANKLSVRFEQITGIKNAFRRNVDSGSFFGGSNQKRFRTHLTENAALGDIVCPSNFTYNIECKHYKQPPLFSSILTQSCKQWDSWIEQAEQDSRNANKKVAIVIKYNNVEEFVLIAEPIHNNPVLQYRNYFIVSLASFLNLPDSNFFNVIHTPGE